MLLEKTSKTMPTEHIPVSWSNSGHHGDKWQGWHFATDGGDPISTTPGPPASGITCELHFPGARADFGPAALDNQTLPCWAVTAILTLKPLDTAVTAPGTPHSTGKLVENGYSHYFFGRSSSAGAAGTAGVSPCPWWRRRLVSEG